MSKQQLVREQGYPQDLVDSLQEVVRARTAWEWLKEQLADREEQEIDKLLEAGSNKEHVAGRLAQAREIRRHLEYIESFLREDYDET